LYTINPTEAVIGSKFYLHIDRPVAIHHTPQPLYDPKHEAILQH